MHGLQAEKPIVMNRIMSKREIIRISLLTLLFGGVWLLIPLTYNEFTLDSIYFKRGVKNLIGIAFLIFINVKFLLPNFYFKGKTAQYIIYGILLLIVLSLVSEYVIDPYFELKRGTPRHRPNSSNNSYSWQITRQINNLMPFLLAFVGSALFEVSRFANQKIKETMLLRSEKLETEMKLLKSQINPHFLFNALNNIYSLSYLKPEKTPENLLKLSEMLRYMLYECNVDKVPLSKEVTYLENYIHMKLLKDSRGMNVKVNLAKNAGHLMIAPLLLIPFVENAFKHSKVEDLEKGWITIDLTTEGHKIIFDVENSVSPTAFTKDEVGGIGLNNVKRQLELLYPKHHQLTIEALNEKYSVHLEIELT